jgi:nucleoid-associated protein YgaU
MSRYERYEILKNSSDLYDNFFKDRNIKYINHLETKQLKKPTIQQLSELNIVEHVWAQHDKYWRLSQKYYGDPTYWWVISFFNEAPTEHELSTGQVIYIPLPLDRILFYIEG